MKSNWVDAWPLIMVEAVGSAREALVASIDDNVAVVICIWATDVPGDVYLIRYFRDVPWPWCGWDDVGWGEVPARFPPWTPGGLPGPG